MVAALTRYAGARAELFQREAVLARRHIVTITILGIIVGACFTLGYVALMAALTAWMARVWWDGQWAPALAVTGGAHVAAAIACAVAARHVWKKHGFFPATRRELNEDRKWLKTTESTK
jgi:uncharacterized membrane protein YqjE